MKNVPHKNVLFHKNMLCVLCLQVRSEIIATYALCGFANISAIGIQLGALGPMAPHRRGDLAGTVVRSLLGGVITGLMTASIAGMWNDVNHCFCGS